MDVPFRHEHGSGRFTASAHEEEALLDAMMEKGDLVTTTEIANPRLSAKMRERGFTPVFGNKGGRDDCGIALRDSRFSLLEGDTARLSHRTYIDERGQRVTPHAAAFAVVKDKMTGKTGVVLVVHMPHGVEGAIAKGNFNSDLTRAYRSYVRGVRRLARELARNYHADWVLIAGDWNLNLSRLWVEAYFMARFVQYRPNFTAPYPKGGTDAGRLIDFALLKGLRPKGEPRIHRRHESGFDHLRWHEIL